MLLLRLTTSVHSQASGRDTQQTKEKEALAMQPVNVQSMSPMSSDKPTNTVVDAHRGYSLRQRGEKVVTWAIRTPVVINDNSRAD